MTKNIMSKLIADLPDTDFIDIYGLQRYDFSFFKHPNETVLEEMHKFKMQAYLLEGTQFGCMLHYLIADQKFDEIVWFEWIQKENSELKHICYSLEFEDLLEEANSEYVSSLLFHLDFFVPNSSKK